MRRSLSVLCALVCVCPLVGCGDYGAPAQRRDASGSIGGVGMVGDPMSIEPGAISSAGTPAAGALPPGALPPGVQPPGTLPPGTPGVTAPGIPPAAPAPGQPGSGVVIEKAGVGATGKGNYSPGIITTPVSVYFKAQERIIFEIQIPHALQLNEALNGFAPKSHEDFMRDIIAFNQIKLPELPPGHEYIYIPEEKALFIKHPEAPPASPAPGQ